MANEQIIIYRKKNIGIIYINKIEILFDCFNLKLKKSGLKPFSFDWCKIATSITAI